LGVQFLWGGRREEKVFQRFIERISEKAAEPMVAETCDPAPLAEEPAGNSVDIPAREDKVAVPGGEPGCETVPNPSAPGSSPASGEAVVAAASEPGSENGRNPSVAAASGVPAGPAAGSGVGPPRARGGRAGSSIVEFLFVLLPLLVVVFGAIEMDRMLLVYNAVANSARSAVRYAAVHGYYNPTTTGNIEQVARNFAAMGLLDPSRANVTVSYEDGTNHVGSPVSVSVAYPFDPFTSFFPLSVTLRSTAKGTITF
jgi:Flp pilus assembly protein TadG